MFRIEGVKVEGLENEVTCASWIGDSHKDVETMLAAGKTSKSAQARDLILDILESEWDGSRERSAPRPGR